MKALTNVDYYLGLAQGLVAVFAGFTDLLSHDTVVLLVAAGAVLTFVRGYIRANPPSAV